MIKKDAKNIEGFTLLEILIALLILATVISIIFSSYTATFRNIEEAESQAEIYQMARITLGRMQEDLECSLISRKKEIPDDTEDDSKSKKETPDNTEDGSKSKKETPDDTEDGSKSKGKTPDDTEDDFISHGFFGKDEKIDDRGADTLSFLSTKHLSLADEDENPGLAEISFYVKKNDGEESFVLYRSDTLKREETPEEKSGGLILCDGLHSVNFTYYNSDGDEYENWDSSEGEFKDRLPAMVSIQLEFVIESSPEEPLKFLTSIALPMAKDTYGG